MCLFSLIKTDGKNKMIFYNQLVYSLLKKKIVILMRLSKHPLRENLFLTKSWSLHLLGCLEMLFPKVSLYTRLICFVGGKNIPYLLMICLPCLHDLQRNPR